MMAARGELLDQVSTEVFAQLLPGVDCLRRCSMTQSAFLDD